MPNSGPFDGRRHKPGADDVGVGRLAVQVVGIEMMRQVRIAAGVPGLVDAVDDAGQLALRGALLHQAVQARTLGFGGDLPRIGRADGGDVAGIEAAGLEERDPAVKLHAVDVERGVRNRQRMALRGIEIALVGDVVDGQHCRDGNAVPLHIGRSQAAGPVVDVDDVRRPAQTGARRGNIRRCQRQPGEAQVVVLPVGALGRAIGRAAAFEQGRRGDQIQDQAVRQPHLARTARRECRSEPAGRSTRQRPAALSGPPNRRA